ncbi:MAG TPA: thioredoxin domain-containing protein [Bacteroidales bacterium]|nr:thioredoxin domain-containing protein [Bacteroidales bacterium]
MKKSNFSLLCLITVWISLFSTDKLAAQHEIPDNIKDYISKGVSAFDSVNIAKAITEFNKAKDIAPDFADTYYYLGETYSLVPGAAARASRSLKKYLELYPDAPDKLKVTDEIAVLEKAVKTKHNTSLRGIELISLRSGIYVKSINQLAYTNTDFAFDARAGVIAGDKLIKINDKDITGLPLQTVIDIIDKEPGNRVLAKIIRGGAETSAVMIKTEKNYPENIFDLGEEDLSEIINAESKPAVVVFWNTWSNECKDYLAILKAAASDKKDSIRIITINVEENVYTTWSCGVSKVPTVLFAKDKKLFGSITGYQPEILKEKIGTIDKITDPFNL